MRICIIGDPHFRFELPYASAFKDGRKSEWEAVKQKIHDTAKNCDAVVMLGDNLNARHNHSSVIHELVDFLKGFGDKEVHIIVGNHERYGPHTALDFLRRMSHPNWFIYDKPTLTNVAGAEAMMIPYMTPALMGVETKEQGLEEITKKFPNYAIPLVFTHHAVAGTKVHGNLVDAFNEIVLNKEELDRHFGHTFAGHIHAIDYLFPNTYITGNIFTNEVGDHNKSVWVYENDGTPDIEIKEVPLPVRGIYKEIVRRFDKTFTFAKIPKNSIVKCVVTMPDAGMDEIRERLKEFDASIIIEQYPNKRSKMHFEDGVLDLSVDGLLKLYAEAKNISYSDLIEGFGLIKK